ncbi:MAG: tetratricopeptide repeat protein [Planctomycetes bacterium]|nr:tetratricopeptide repeat protein [Planctomycetota bacterium]
MSRVSQAVVIGLGLVALTLVAYAPALGCGYVWDDDDYVTANPVLRTVADFARIWLEPRSLPQYYPLVHTSFWLEYRAWGLAPLGYHLVNVLLHGTSAVLLWRLLRRLALPGALLAAALFAVHPVHVESVAWVTERKNVLSLLFYLLAFHAWLRWRGDPASAAARGPARGPGAYALVLLAFVAALLSKTVTCSFPAAVLLVVWWRSGRLPRRDVVAMLPLFAIGLGFAWLTAHLEATHVGADTLSFALSPAERALVAGRAVWFYAGKLLAPFGLTFIYPRWVLDTGSVAQWLWPVAALGVVAAAWAWRARLGRGPLTALLLFGGTLVPALGFVVVYPFRYSFVADHFQYHASIALLAGFAAVATGIAARRVAAARTRVALAAAPVVALAVATALQCPIYRDVETLWRDTLRKNPNAQIAHVNLGKILLDRGELGPAIEHLETSLRLDASLNEAHVNLAAARFEQRDFAAAREHLEAAIALRPDLPVGYQNLALVEHAEGHPERALELAEQAVAKGPFHYPSQRTLAMLLIERGRYAEALDHVQKALQSRGEDADARLLAADALLGARQFDQAAGNAAIAWRARPGDPEVQRRLVDAAVGLTADLEPDRARGWLLGLAQALGPGAAGVLGATGERLAAERRLRLAAAALDCAALVARQGGAGDDARRYAARAAELAR